MSQPTMKLSGIVLDSPDAQELSAFYHRLLGWAVQYNEPDWVKLSSPDGGPGLSFQAEYQPQDDVRVFLDPAGHPSACSCRARETKALLPRG